MQLKLNQFNIKAGTFTINLFDIEKITINFLKKFYLKCFSAVTVPNLSRKGSYHSL